MPELSDLDLVDTPNNMYGILVTHLDSSMCESLIFAG